MGLFGSGKKVFGRRDEKLSFAELKNVMRPAPDSDGVTRVFSKELWDDPKIGSLLREVGLHPDSPQNIQPTIEDYQRRFSEASERLSQRVAAFNRLNQDRFGHCRAAPLFVIDRPIWDGRYGSFLFAQLELVAFDDWNVLMVGLDEESCRRCGLTAYPGPLPQLEKIFDEHITRLHARHEHALEAYGLTATGQKGGISRDAYEALRQQIIDELKGLAAFWKAKLAEIIKLHAKA